MIIWYQSSQQTVDSQDNKAINLYVKDKQIFVSGVSIVKPSSSKISVMAPRNNQKVSTATQCKKAT